jgi:hypothetical protein
MRPTTVKTPAVPSTPAPSLVIDLDTAKVTIREVADVVALVAIELVGTVSQDSREADVRLEELAGRLMDYVDALPEGHQRLLMGAIAETLMATEEGSSPPE